KPPFRAETPLDTLMMVINDDPVPPSRLHHGVPRDLETVCLKCLQKSPRRRYPSARALADDLQRYLDGLPVLARRIGMWERFLHWAKRRPATAGLIVFGFISLITLACALFYRHYSSRLATALATTESALERLEKEQQEKARAQVAEKAQRDRNEAI